VEPDSEHFDLILCVRIRQFFDLHEVIDQLTRLIPVMIRHNDLSILVDSGLNIVKIGIYTYDRRFLKFDPWQMWYLHELVKK